MKINKISSSLVASVWECGFLQLRLVWGWGMGGGVWGGGGDKQDYLALSGKQQSFVL